MSVITYGSMVHVCLEAAQRLAGEGAEAEVIDLRTLLPFDRKAILDSVRRTGKALIVHEDNKTGGVGAEFAAIIAEEAFEHLDGPVRRVASIDTPVPYSPPLEEFYMPNVDKVLAAMRDLAAY
jgi:2-oxoisovalerate dehydrogenase E1 component beta subunit